MFGISPEWIIVLIIVILVFGIGKLPQVGKSLGEAMREFRGNIKDDEATDGADSFSVQVEPERVKSDTVKENYAAPEPAELSPASADKVSLTIQEALDQATTLEKEQRLAFALNAILEMQAIKPYRLAETSGVDRATISRWLRAETHPQQDKLERVLDVIPGLSPYYRQEILTLAGYIAAEAGLSLPHPPQIYLSCHGEDLVVERQQVAEALGHPALAFKVEMGEATLPPAEVEACVRHSDYLVMVQGWRWVSVRHLEYQAASEEREKVTGLYFQRTERSLQPAAEQFRNEVGQEKWRSYAAPEGLTIQMLSELWQALTREARAGRAVSLHSLAGLYLLTQWWPHQESTISALLQRLVKDSEPGVRIQVSEPEKPAAQAKKWTKRHPEEPEMVLIPAGKFWMGSDRLTLELAGVKWQDWMKDEMPYHQLYLPDYAIGCYPVTNAEFARFIADGGYRQREFWTAAGWQAKQENKWTQPSFWTEKPWNQANHPVVGIGWYESVAYCRWLTKITGRLYRLPTEAEWEKAARGPDGNLWPWGNSWNPSRCNTREKGPGHTTRVGRYSPAGDSYYGLADMVGNVWECCATKQGKPYPFEVGEKEWATNYLEDSNVRVWRGGSWGNLEDIARCASRYRYGWILRFTDFGCRVVSPI